MILLTLLLAAQEPLDLRLDAAADWGVPVKNARKVLAAAGGELRKHAATAPFPAIEIAPKGGPIALYKRGPKGEARVKLDVHGPYWAQYTYQFAHELTHVLCGNVEVAHKQKWFEESLCEAASLFVLRRSAETWATDPPDAGWKDFAPAFTRYADDRLSKTALPDGQSFAAWWAERKAQCEADATDRPRNTIIAARLLPLFEATPAGWDALPFLHKERLGPDASFSDLLEYWELACPVKHKSFVAAIRKLFLP
jgi:hypothetical protein